MLYAYTSYSLNLEFAIYLLLMLLVPDILSENQYINNLSAFHSGLPTYSILCMKSYQKLLSGFFYVTYVTPYKNIMVVVVWTLLDLHLIFYFII